MSYSYTYNIVEECITEDKTIGLELRSLNNLIMRYFENSPYRKQIDSITGTNGWIICFLSENNDKDIYQRDLEKHFTITRSTISRVLNLMEHKGLIERHAVAHDARLKKIVLTDKAWQVSEMIKLDREKMESALTKGFSYDDLQKLHSCIEIMISNINQEIINRSAENANFNI